MTSFDPTPGTYDKYIRDLIDSGDARECVCTHPGCHCAGIADNVALGYDRCACCMADCPDVHDPQEGLAPGN